MQALTEQTLIEKIQSLPPEKFSEVVDFVDFLAERQQKAQDAGDVAEVLRCQDSANPAERRTLDDLRQARNQ